MDRCDIIICICNTNFVFVFEKLFMFIFVQGFSEDVFSQFDPVLGNKVRKTFSLPSNQALLLKKREIMKSCSQVLLLRSGSPTSSSRWCARPRSARTSCWRTLKTPPPPGSPATSHPGWARRGPTGSTLSSRWATNAVIVNLKQCK